MNEKQKELVEKFAREWFEQETIEKNSSIRDILTRFAAELLAEAFKEPVAWECSRDDEHGNDRRITEDDSLVKEYRFQGWQVTPLYRDPREGEGSATADASEEPGKEFIAPPVAPERWVVEFDFGDEHNHLWRRTTSERGIFPCQCTANIALQKRLENVPQENHYHYRTRRLEEGEGA